MSVAIIRDPVCLRHSNGSGHPERAERLEALDRMLDSSPHRRRLKDLPARDALPEELAWVHSAEHIATIESSSRRPFTVLDADTAASSDSYASALRAAGGALTAVDAVLSRRHEAAFALVRPPGHHAESDRAMGFCLFNNVAIAAEYACRRHGVERVLILDWDVHHGNGTMHSFYESPAVMYASLHQYPYYPGTGSHREIGAGAGEGYTVNVPLPPRQTDTDYLYVFEKVLIPVFDAFAPQLLLVSAGFDAHAMDPLADMQLTTPCFGAMTRAVQEVARVHDAPLALVLEGGYSVAALAEGVASVLEALVSPANGAAEWRRVAGEVSTATTEVVGRLRAVLAPFWPILGAG